MAMTKAEIVEWLSSFDDDDNVAIDDGGLTLVVIGDPISYLEIGGIRDEEDDEDGE